MGFGFGGKCFSLAQRLRVSGLGCSAWMLCFTAVLVLWDSAANGRDSVSSSTLGSGFATRIAEALHLQNRYLGLAVGCCQVGPK